MTGLEAANLLARLRVHFPTIVPSDDRLARVVAHDWIATLLPTDLAQAHEAVTMIVTSWHANDPAPRIGDFRDTLRGIQQRGEMERSTARVGELAAPPPDRVKFANLISKARAQLAKPFPRGS